MEDALTEWSKRVLLGAAAVQSEGGSETEEEDIDPLHAISFSASVLIILMVAWITLGHKFAASTKFAGEGSAACLLGLAVGAALFISRQLFHQELIQNMLSFDPANFFIFFLPPIILYAGLSVKKKHFFRNFFTIAGYGILGTYVCFAILALGMYLFLSGTLRFGDCLGLAAIIAATDSVATLQVLSQDRFPLLYSMVFGEGVLNDATSVVILGTIKTLNLQEARELTAGVIGLVFLDFVYLFVLSLILGAVIGLVTAFLLRRFHFEHTAHEVALIGMTAYLSYVLGDVLGLSGILALFVCAVTISHYALHNISAQSRTTTIYAFQTLSLVSEGIIFIYCGMDALDPAKWKNTNIWDLLWMFWIIIILLLVSRAAFVIPISLLHNRASAHKLSTREIVVVWWAGLMRGAVSVALVYYLYDPHGKNQDAHESTLITTTLIVVLISILMFGAATKPLLEYLMGPDKSAHAAHSNGIEMPESKIEYAPLYHAGGSPGSAAGANATSAAHPYGLYSDDPAWHEQAAAAPAEVAPYQDDDFSPLAGAAALPARASTGGLAEVAVHASPASQTAKGKAGGAPGAINLAADGRGGTAAARALQPGTAPARESSGNEYAPDSKALLARVNRWWKAFDEGVMQPHFGGPAASRHGSMANLAEAAAGGGGIPSRSGRSFTVPATIGSTSLHPPQE